MQKIEILFSILLISKMLIKFIKEINKIGYNIEKCNLYDTEIPCHRLINIFNNYLMIKYNNVNCIFDREEQNIKMFRIDLGFVTQEYNYKKIKFIFNSYNYMNKFIHHIITRIKQMSENEVILLIPLVLLIIDKDNIRKAHTIMLIYRKYKNCFEYYDSNGICHDNTYIYNRTNRLIHDIIYEMNIFENEKKNKYIFKNNNTSSSSSYIGLQRIENEYGDNKGYCTIWSMFFGELVLLNPSMKNADLIRNLYNWLNKNNNMNSLFLRNLIINYLYNIQKIAKNQPRQEIL